MVSNTQGAIRVTNNAFQSIIGGLSVFAQFPSNNWPGSFDQCTEDIMSDAHNDHHSFIRTPKQLIAAVTGFFLVIVIGIILLVSFVTETKLTGAGTESQSAEATAARLRPIADEGFTLKDANAPKVLLDAAAVFTANCAACHTTGAAGAPKLGDASAWSARIAEGYDTLLKHAVEGIRAMPPKGGNPELDNVEVARAVVYMANQSGAKFKEPEVPAPATATAVAIEATPAVAPTPASATATAAPLTPTATAPAAATPATASVDTGKKVFDAACVACHGTGIAGAPKLADKAAWAPRVQQGTAVLYEHAIKGFQGKTGVMPPKGGASVSDDEVKAAVDYMLASAK
jgi:cytochrome c5